MTTVSVRYIVDDVDAAIAFYCKHLGFREQMHPAPTFAMLTHGDLRLVLSAPSSEGGGGQSMPDGTVPQPGGWNRFSLQIEDLDGAATALRAAGVPFRNEIVVGVGGKQVLIEDPSGNPVELFEPTVSEARLDETEPPTDDVRILGSLRSTDGGGVVRIEDTFDADADDLWAAITDPQRLAHWYGEVEGDLKVGGVYRTFLAGPGLHAAGRIEACERLRHLRVVSAETDESWKLGDTVPDLDGFTDVTLTAEGGRTTLVIETGWAPLDQVAFYGVGWQLHVEHLADYLAGVATVEKTKRPRPVRRRQRRI